MDGKKAHKIFQWTSTQFRRNFPSVLEKKERKMRYLPADAIGECVELRTVVGCCRKMVVVLPIGEPTWPGWDDAMRTVWPLDNTRTFDEGALTMRTPGCCWIWVVCWCCCCCTATLETIFLNCCCVFGWAIVDDTNVGMGADVVMMIWPCWLFIDEATEGDRIDCAVAALTLYEIGVAVACAARIGVFGDERTCPVEQE